MITCKNIHIFTISYHRDSAQILQRNDFSWSMGFAGGQRMEGSFNRITVSAVALSNPVAEPFYGF